MEDKAFIILAPCQAHICMGEDSVRGIPLAEIVTILLFGPKRLTQKYEVINLLGYREIHKVPKDLIAPFNAMFAVRPDTVATIEKAAAACRWLKDVTENHPEQCVIREILKENSDDE